MSTEPRVLAGRYRVDDVIGQGGMAKVHRGYDLTLGREVAIKILDPELARDTAFRTRFRLEAQAASRMSHPSIVRVFDAGDPSGQGGASGTQTEPYIVMELVRGTLLKDIIARGPLSIDDAVRYADGILEALEYSHRAGVVHRDIKPGNVMITADGSVKVMDFGIARAVSDSSSTVAQTTQIIGTAAYFSPEQAKGESIDARTDLYSAGVVLYEMLTGRQPFRGDSPVAVAYQHVSETPEPPSEIREDLPRSLDAIVLRALAKDPFQRFPDAHAFRAELTHATGGQTPSKKQIGVLTSELYGPNPRHAQEAARSLRQLSTDTTMTRTQSGPPVAWIWAGVILMGVLLVSVLFWVTSLAVRPDVPSTTVTVPNMVGMTIDDAKQALADEGLVPDVREESSSEFDEDHVIRSSPNSGAKLNKGGSVLIYVSTGTDMIEMPIVEGLTLDAAKKALADAGLALGTVEPVSDKDAAAGTVLSVVNVEANAEVAPGTVINLRVATGRVTVENLFGFALDSAVTYLEDRGLTAEPTSLGACGANQTPNTVISTSVAPGDIEIHSTVEVRYCVAEDAEEE